MQCKLLCKDSCIPPKSGDQANIKHLHVILHKQTGEPYDGFCTCTLGLIYYWKKQLCQKRNQKNYLTKVVYFAGGHTLADDITSEYPIFLISS